MVSVSDFGPEGQECIHVVFLGKTRNIYTPPSCINGNQQIAWGQPHKIQGGNLRWTSIPSRGSRNTPSCFILEKPELSARTDESSWLSRRLGQSLR